MALNILTGSVIGLAETDLLKLLEEIPGKKDVFIQPDLLTALNLNVKFPTPAHGVNRIFHLSQDVSLSTQKTVIFISRSDGIADVKAVAETLAKISNPSTQTIPRNIHIFCIPENTHLITDALEASGTLGEPVIHEYPLYFIRLASDVLSLELNTAFKDLYWHQDSTSIHTMAVALMRLQKKFGLFPRITGKGQFANQLCDILFKMREEHAATASDSGPSSGSFDLTPSSIVDSVIVIDRQVDFASALLTQLTYEGLIDEEYGIRAQHAEFDSKTVNGQLPSSTISSASSPLKKNVLLSCDSATYQLLQDKTLRPAILTLQEVDQKADERLNLETMTIKQDVTVHIGIAGALQDVLNSGTFFRVQNFEQTVMNSSKKSTAQHDTLKDLMARGIPVWKALRLLCLESCVYDGYTDPVYNNLRTCFIRAYGPQHLLTLANLEKMGLLNTRIGGSAFRPAPPTNSARPDYVQARKLLDLYQKPKEGTQANDISYVFSGMAPLSVRLVQCVLQKQFVLGLVKPTWGVISKPVTNIRNGSIHGWVRFENAADNAVIQTQGGPAFDRVQSGDESATRVKQLLAASSSSSRNNSDQAPETASQQNLSTSLPPSDKVILVVFLGGITRSEISALRFVSNQLEADGIKRKLLICTTNVITGNTVVEAAVEKGDFKSYSVPGYPS